MRPTLVNTVKFQRPRGSSFQVELSLGCAGSGGDARGSMADPAGLFDDAMDKHRGSEWVYDVGAVPQCGDIAAEEIDDPISLSDFVRGALRSPHGVKSATTIISYHSSLPELGSLHRIGDAIRQGRVADIPAEIRPRGDLPDGAKLGVVVCSHDGGSCEAITVMYFNERVDIKTAVGYCTGQALVPVFRPGPWAVKKALHSLIARLPGYHADWPTLTQKHRTDGSMSSAGATWNPPNDLLRKGIDWINANAPHDDADNEQTFWIMANIKAESGTAIAGWPEAKVRSMAQNKSRGKAGASTLIRYPLHTYSTKPVLADVVLPMVYPLLMSFGVIMAGWAGVGKTPLFITMAMAMGRYHVKRLGLDAAPGWRRAKSLESFRHRVGQVHEAMFLDDPNRAQVSLADFKNFMTADEEGDCSARYNDVKLAAHSTRGYACNDIRAEDEPPPDDRVSITTAEFETLMGQLFLGEKPSHVMAVLKRAVVMVFGKHALYLRFPSKTGSTTIHRIVDSDVHQDALMEAHKPFLNQHKLGLQSQPPGFEADVAREQAMIEAAVRDYAKWQDPDAYVKGLDKKLADKLQSSRPASIVVTSAPPTQSQDITATLERDGTWSIPIGPTSTTRCAKRSRFAANFEVHQVAPRASAVVGVHGHEDQGSHNEDSDGTMVGPAQDGEQAAPAQVVAHRPDDQSAGSAGQSVNNAGADAAGAPGINTACEDALFDMMGMGDDQLDIMGMDVEADMAVATDEPGHIEECDEDPFGFTRMGMD